MHLAIFVGVLCYYEKAIQIFLLECYVVMRKLFKLFEKAIQFFPFF